MNYVKNLRFQDKPDYKYLRNMLKKLFDKKGFIMDYNYSWNKIRQEKIEKEKAA